MLLVLAVIVIVSGETMVHGLRRAGRILFTTGVLSWASYYITQRLNEGFQVPTTGFEKEADLLVSQKILTPVIQEAIRDITTTALWLSLTVTVFGGLLWLAGFFWHKTQHHQEVEAIAKRAMANKAAQTPADQTLPAPADPQVPTQPPSDNAAKPRGKQDKPPDAPTPDDAI
jgi:Na+-driven multidrug efflux pump